MVPFVLVNLALVNSLCAALPRFVPAMRVDNP